MIGNRARIVVGAVCLLLSGATALFYELIWSHQFSIVFGSSEIATASELGIYLAGLGFGAALALRRLSTPVPGHCSEVEATRHAWPSGR